MTLSPALLVALLKLQQQAGMVLQEGQEILQAALGMLMMGRMGIMALGVTARLLLMLLAAVLQPLMIFR